MTSNSDLATKDLLSNYEGVSARQRALATRAVASAATDADDCAQLLEALGLDANEGQSSAARQAE